MSYRAGKIFRLRSGGFTLLDLIAGLGIFIALAAIAIPNLGAQLPAYRLNSAVRQVQSELNRIKSQAISNNAEFRAVFLAPSRYRIEKKIGGAYQPTGENKVLPDGISYANGSAALISFTPRGTSSSDTIKLCNSRREGKNIVVFGGTGRLRIANGVC